MSSNSFQGPDPDLASLLSMIQGGGPLNVGGLQQQNQQQYNTSTGSGLPNSGTYVQNATGADPAITSFLLQGLLNLGQHQRLNPRNGLNDMLSLLSAQQLGQPSYGGQAFDLGRVSTLGLLGSLQQGGENQLGQLQNLASLLNSQGNSSHQRQEQALALLTGARLLSGDDCLEDSNLSPNESTKPNLPSQTKSVATDISSPFFAHRNTVIADSAEDSARGRNLEPGAVAVPCRARGMPMDHNPLTAYFVINNGIRHGEDVVCSHPSCRNAGVKFRYCSFCKAPVAKRNFRRRHNHDGDNSLSGSDSPDDESAKMTTISRKSCRSVIATGEEPQAKRSKLTSSRDDDVETTTDSSKSSSNKGRKSSSSKADAEKTGKHEAPDPKPGKNTEPLVDTREADFSKTTVKASDKRTTNLERLQQWAKLLDERPISSDSYAMSAWIEKVLKVSDASPTKKESTQSEAVRSANDKE